MSTRDDILAGLRIAEPGSVGDETPEELLDRYRAEVLAEAADRLHKATLLADDCGCVEILKTLATGWLPNGGHDASCAYVSGMTSRCTCKGAGR